MDMVRRVLPTIANKEELEKDIATVYNGTGALEPRAFNTIVNKLWNADRQVVLSDYASVREKAEQRLVNDQELGMFRPIVQTFVDKATAKKTTEKYTSYDAAWKDVLLFKERIKKYQDTLSNVMTEERLKHSWSRWRDTKGIKAYYGNLRCFQKG